MLLKEKIENTTFSETEKDILDFILEKEELIDDYTTTQIASMTYTSPSLLVRIAKKLGYNGWSEFKKDYVNEVKYLKEHFNDINANYPFNKTDNIMTVANKVRQLEIDSVKDTLSLIEHDTL